MNINFRNIYSVSHLGFLDKIIFKKKLEILSVIKSIIDLKIVDSCLDIGTTSDINNQSSNSIIKNLPEINILKSISDQKINIIISANITSERYRSWCKKNLKNIVQIYIKAKIEELIKRDYKGLYKKALKKKIKNVVGIDLPFRHPKKVDLYLENNSSKKDFLKKIKLIFKFFKKKKIKIY